MFYLSCKILIFLTLSLLFVICIGKSKILLVL